MQEKENTLKRITRARLFWPLAALAIVLLFDLFFIKGFFSLEVKEGHLYGRIIDIIKNASPLMLLAIGMTLVVATKGIDISVGSVCAISGAIAAALVGGDLSGVPKSPYFLAIIVALGCSLLLGTWNGFLVTNLGIQPMVATLILMVAGRGIAQLITQGQIITVYYKPYSFLGSGYIPVIGLPFSILIIAAVLLVILLIVKKTAFGMFVECVGINSLASRYTGIRVNKVIFLAYAFCGLCAGIAGLIISSITKAADGNNAGLFIEMDAILAVAMGGNSLNGGRFSVVASVIGALVIQCLTTTMYALGVSPQVLPVVKALVVISICLIQAEDFRRIIFGLFDRNRGVQREKNAVKL